MIGTIVTAHAQFGFFMNWSGQQAGEGIEYALLAIALAASLVFHGGGAWSIDKTLANRLAHKS